MTKSDRFGDLPGLPWILWNGISCTLLCSSVSALAIDLLIVGFSSLSFHFLVFPRNHHAAMQDINRCLVVEAREKLPELGWLIFSLLLLIYDPSCCTNNEILSWFCAAAYVVKPIVHTVTQVSASHFLGRQKPPLAATDITITVAAEMPLHTPSILA